MRTRLSIDAELLARARQPARGQGITLDAVVEKALGRDLASESRPVPVFTDVNGPQPGIDLTSNRVLHEVVAEKLPLNRLR